MESNLGGTRNIKRWVAGGSFRVIFERNNIRQNGLKLLKNGLRETIVVVLERGEGA